MPEQWRVMNAIQAMKLSLWAKKSVLLGGPAKSGATPVPNSARVVRTTPGASRRRTSGGGPLPT